MNLDKLYQILGDCTVQLRKGEVVEREQTKGLDVTHVYAMPHEHEAQPHVEKVDVEFMVVGVDRERAETHRAELVEILNTYPRPDRLQGGPSYIEVGAEIGDQGAAFQLFAIGQVLGFWKIITPTILGFKGAEARQMAGMGMVMISGYRPTVTVPTPSV